MKSEEIRRRFLEFFEKRGHKIIPSASLVTPDEKGVTNQTLFNGAGMQPLIPYLLGKPHPSGRRLANVQKCLRTVDIDEVGDATHATFFEMLGNWSLGDYFKAEAIKWSFELLTDKKEGFGLDPKRLYVTIFEGDDNAPSDFEAFEIWKKYIPENRIYFLSAQSNWWEAGDNGPCGPDTEMFYDITKEGLGVLTKEQYLAADEARKVVEVWNNVFMEYEKRDGKIVGKLPQKNVDTGAGLERLAMVLQGVNNIYDTDIFSPLIEKLNKFSPMGELRTKRVITDHIRTAAFILAEGVTPSNVGRGYVLRRLIRRAIRFGRQLDLTEQNYLVIIDAIAKTYNKNHSDILKNIRMIENGFLNEMRKFSTTLEKGLGVLNKKLKPQILTKGQPYKLQEMRLIHGPNNIQIWNHVPHIITGKWLFDFYQTFGFPLELTIEELKTRGDYFSVLDYKKLEVEFNLEMKEHQTLSRSAAEQKFKGGLANAEDEQVVKYHTATHLLHQALHEVLGDQVSQKGSNITAERLRFDFTHSQKMTEEEKRRVEAIVNQKISEDLPVQKIILPKEEALKTGAYHSFNEKYGDEVSIYFIGENLATAFSKEFCGGPHVTRAGVLGKFKIIKEEAVAAGVRRIKAILE